jgi:hypothetical protein
MSSSVFPTFAGLKINVKRTPVYATKVSTSSSGKETRLSFQSTPRFRYSLELEFLRTAVNGNEVATLLAFIDTMKGAWDDFLFNDPYSGSQVRVRFEEEAVQYEQFASGYWLVKSLSLISVK